MWRKKRIEMNCQQKRLTDPDSLKQFFRKCEERGNGVEPDWEDHKKLILVSYQAGNRQ